MLFVSGIRARDLHSSKRRLQPEKTYVRALQTMVLCREGIIDPRFSSIEEYIGNHSADYYNVLAEVGQGAWHPDRDPLPWIRFCLVAHYKQARNLLRRLADMGRLWRVLEDETKKRRINERHEATSRRKTR